MARPAISEEEVRRLARLARLFLSEEEITALTAELSTVLEYVSELSCLDLAAEEAEEIIPREAGNLREDAPRDAGVRAPALDAAPGSREGLFVVPRVIG